MSSAASLEELAERFVLDEARMLDDRRYAHWPELFLPDGWYWMPSQPDQESPHTAVSIVYEERRLLELRIRRLLHPATPVENPPALAHRHLNSIVATVQADSSIEVNSLMVIFVLRERIQHILSARVRHELAQTGDGLRIRSKTVRLLNCDSPLFAFAAPF